MVKEGAETRRWPSALPGAIMALVGAIIIAVVFVAFSGGVPSLDWLAFALGLAWGPLVLGVAQVLVLVGAWLVWRAWRRPGSPE